MCCSVVLCASIFTLDHARLSEQSSTKSILWSLGRLLARLASEHHRYISICGQQPRQGKIPWSKCVLCITPVLLILLLNTADYGDEDDDEKAAVRRELVSRLSVQMAIDLLDTIEMLDIVLEEKERDYGISSGFGTAMIVVACVSFLISLSQMFEIKFDDDGKPAKLGCKTTLIRTTGEMIAVNLAFLIIRLVVFFKYEKDESIFIAKNGIAIILSSLEISDLVGSLRQN